MLKNLIVNNNCNFFVNLLLFIKCFLFKTLSLNNSHSINLILIRHKKRGCPYGQPLKIINPNINYGTYQIGPCVVI